MAELSDKGTLEQISVKCKAGGLGLTPPGKLRFLTRMSSCLSGTMGKVEEPQTCSPGKELPRQRDRKSTGPAETAQVFRNSQELYGWSEVNQGRVGGEIRAHEGLGSHLWALDFALRSLEGFEQRSDMT